MKKRIVMFLAATMAATGVWAEWTDPDTGYIWMYRVNGDTAEIYGDYVWWESYDGSYWLFRAAISPKPTGAVTIPSTLGGKPLTSIGGGAFRNCDGLTSVTIGDGVTNIGDCAFWGCGGLTSVTIPNSVTSIGNDVFYECSGLTSVTISQYVVDRSLYSVFPDSLQSLREITFSDNVTHISEECCRGFTNLEKVCIPDSVTEIAENAFETCGSIVDVTIPWRPDLKVSKLFPDSYMKIKKITLVGEKPDRIPDGAFEGCESLEEIDVPDTVRDVGASAFRGCKAFKELPALPTGFVGVTNIGASAFADCTGLEAVDWSWWPLIGEIPSSLFKGCTNLKRVEGVPSSVGRIGTSAFEDCEGLTRMLLPASVTDMGIKVFQGCSGLTDVQLPPAIKAVPDYTFNGCASLTGVTMPSSPTAIGKGAFFGCNQMMGITIPESVTRIGDYAFGECWRLNGLAVPDGVGAVPEGLCYGCRRLNGISLPRSMTKIGALAFYGCSGLTSVTIPNSVTNIGDSAFWDCSGLASVMILGGVTKIGTLAFSGCGLTNVIFNGDAPTIGGDCFDGVDPTCIVYVRRGSTGWGVGIPGTWNGMKIAYADSLPDSEPQPDPVESSPVEVVPVMPEPVESDSGVSDPVTPGYVVMEEKDVITPYEASKAVTLQGVAYDGGAVVGVVELKLGKVNDKKGTSKVSGSVTTLDGKKHKITAFNVTEIDGTTPKAVSLEVKDIGAMAVTIGGTQFAGSMGKYHVQSAVVGGNATGTGTKVYVDAGGASGGRALPAGTLEDLLPKGEPVVASGGKWKFAKAASVKWAKPKQGAALPERYDAESGKGLVVDTSGDKTNLSAMKLTYTPKKGTFKGSFKVYALEGAGKATKLKKYTVKVSGVVVGGVGYGTAMCKTPAVSWAVKVE